MARRMHWKEPAWRVDFVSSITNFWRDDQGQDLIEYTLLLAFLALASAALMIGAGASIQNIWTVTNSTLDNAATVANSVSP